MLKSTAISLSLALFALSANAHPGEVHHEPSAAELARRSHSAAKRSTLAAQCSSQIKAHRLARRNKRSIIAHAKREIPTSVLAAAAPQYTSLQNTTCVLAPEVTEGPYYAQSQLVRQDLREDQGGVDLVLDIGVIDINTCEPVENVYVEIWSANATGVYSDFATDQRLTADQQTSTSYLRGGWPTNAAGIVELTTKFPGFYTGRTIHTHMMLRSNYSIEDDGTLLASSGSVHHIGQLFFDETLANEIVALEPYSTTTQSRTLNAADSILSTAGTNGNSVIADTELLGDDVSDGVLGYITVGIDLTASYSVRSTTTLTSIVDSVESSALAALSAAVSATTTSSSSSNGASSSTGSSAQSSAGSGTGSASTQSTATGVATSATASSSSTTTSGAGVSFSNGLMAAGSMIGAAAFLMMRA